MMPLSSVEIYQDLGGTNTFLLKGKKIGDGGCMFIRSLDKYLQDFTAPHFGMLRFSQTQPRESLLAHCNRKVAQSNNVKISPFH
jgi:hypothetical protein